MSSIKRVSLPLLDTADLKVGQHVEFSGRILCGRDAVLPKVCDLIKRGKIGSLDANFKGAAIFHTAVSCAGIGPTSSNKVEIEESFEPLCRAGIKVFLGKGEIHPSTVEVLKQYGAVFAVVPPVTALLTQGMRSKRIVAFSELGMEALYEVELKSCPAIIASVGGESMFNKEMLHAK